MNKNGNKISPKALLHSKWSKVAVTNKEKHFIITVVTFDEQQKVIECVIQAVMTKNEYTIDWRELKDSDKWKIGWQ
ncbi:TIGR02450 family Trp-rich protein [Colwellia ponticola]|uniref:TIGR02450 family Trp-rich protein n=1 Tax=Colwellia ponticola TaxID=2304625 RepID=A0A8H2PK27_9GAMM|nr:TIGR02450 family Trp-rich protein [Colwellia ponticola]TMM43954.1 TIGR02450 family Trp-rich protein [Colwellia ponticola]